MARTKTSLFQRAVGHVGQTGKVRIADPDEDTSDARTVRTFYDAALDAFLEEAWWSFATAYENLGEATTDPPEFWAYTYVMPTDLVSPRRIISFAPEDIIPFEEGNDEDDLAVLWCDTREAQLEYTKRVENFNQWSPLAFRAFSLFLAIEIAPSYTGGTKVQELQFLYDIALDKAQAASANRQERRPDEGDEFNDQRHGRDVITQRSNLAHRFAP